MPFQFSDLALLTLFLTLTATHGQNCDTPLGFENGGIRDDQLTASSSSATFTIDQVRLHVGRGWVPAKGTSNQYMVVNFQAQHSITSYKIQGAGEAGFVRNLTFFYSQNGLTWMTYVTFTGAEVLSGADNSESTFSHQLSPTIKARYLAVQSLDNDQALRLELFGCRLEKQETVQYTVVTGDIQESEDWNLDGSPYIINSEIQILASGRLTVHPGVNVVFNASTSGIKIFGHLEVNGSSSSVEFGHPRPFSHETDRWTGLTLADQGKVKLNGCRIYGAKAGLTGPLGSMSIWKCHFLENSIGIRLTKGTLDQSTFLRETLITDNTWQGILLADSAPGETTVVIEDCQILNNGYGFQIDTSVNLIARNSVFSKNTWNGISNDRLTHHQVKLSVDNCTFEENVKSGLDLRYFGQLSNSTFNISISNSRFRRNKDFAVYVRIDHAPKELYVLLKDSYVSENRASGVTLRLPRYGEGDGLIYIRNNRFEDIEGGHPLFRWLLDVYNEYAEFCTADVFVEGNNFIKGAAMKLDGSDNVKYMVSDNNITTSKTWEDDGVTVSGGDTYFRDNRFINCTSPRVVKGEAPFKLARNVFENPGAEFDLFLEYNIFKILPEDPINATYNYWGSSDLDYIRSRIYDFFANMEQVRVEMTPFYTTGDMTHLSSLPDSSYFQQTEDTVGGFLNRSVTLGPHQNLRVVRSIYIPEGTQLTVLQNVVLHFQKDIGIHVKGSLIVRGDKDNVVVLDADPTNNQRWGGIRIDGTGTSIQHAAIQKFKWIFFKSKAPVSATINNSYLSSCDSVISGRLTTDLDLHLNNLNVQNCYSWMFLSIYNGAAATVDVNECVFDTTQGLDLSQDSSGSLNVSISKSQMYSEVKGFLMESCSTEITMQVEETVLRKRSSYTEIINIKSSRMDVKFRSVEPLGNRPGISFKFCPQNKTSTAGRIEIMNSFFLEANSFIDITTPEDDLFLPHNVVLLNNTFGRPNVLIDTNPSSGDFSVHVESNTFELSGITIKGSPVNITLERNIFKGRNYNVTVLSKGNSTGSVNFTRNELKGYDGKLNLNSGRPDDVMTISENHLQNVFAYINASEVHVLANTFEDSILDLESRADNDTVIKENVFRKGKFIFTNPNAAISRNRFYDITQDIRLQFKGYCYPDKIINCSHNFWDVRHIYEISSRVLDSEDDPNLPVINVLPFYRYPNFTGLQYSQKEPKAFFLLPNGSIGGSVRGSVTLTAKGSPYLVTDNIVVDKLSTLILEHGVTLWFSRNLGMTVRGKLRILGTASHPVYAMPYENGVKWFGIRLLRTPFRPESPPDIRLVGSCPEKEGKVKIMREGTWKSVCGSDFDQLNARVVCRSLGYDPDTDHMVLQGDPVGEDQEIVHGKFDCKGTESNLSECPMTTFNCSSRTAASVRCWGKKLPRREDIGNEVEIHHFIVNDTQIGLEINGNVTEFEYVESSHATSNGMTFISDVTRHAPLKIPGLTATNNGISGISFQLTSHKNIQPRIELLECRIINNNLYGIYIGHSLNISLRLCHFEGIGRSAIRLRGEASIDISNCNFERNHGVFDIYDSIFTGKLHFSLKDSNITRCGVDNDIISFQPSYTRSCRYDISNNVFSSNTGNLIYFSLYGTREEHNVQIGNNVFINNKASILTVLSPLRNRLTFDLFNNTITGNKVDRKPLVKFEFERRSPEKETQVYISENNISDNEALSVIDIENPRGYRSNFTIIKNDIRNNNCTNTVNVTSFRVSLKNNLFMNRGATCELESPVFRRGADTDARLNYWGTSNMEEVSRRICGFDSNMSRGFIYYLPFFKSENMKETSDNALSHSWTENLQGGLIEGKLYLEKTSSPYHIKRSVYIRNGGELRIASGVEFQFEPNTGIYVDGTLLARNAMFKRAGNSSWHGVVFPYMSVVGQSRARLVDGERNTEGRVEMCTNGTWARVCNMDYIDVMLICRDLGYESGSVEVTSIPDPDMGHGHVVTDMGCMESMWSLRQCQSTGHQNVSVCDNVRVVCHQDVRLDSTENFSYLEGVSVLDSNVGLVIETATVKLSRCHVNNTENVGMTLKGFAIDLDLNGTVIEHGKSDGILVKVEKDFKIRNGTVRNNRGNGLTVITFLRRVNIEKMFFIDNYASGVVIARFTTSERFLRVKDNVFQGQQIGLLIDMGAHDYDGRIYIEDNLFTGNTKLSIDIKIFGSGPSRLTRELYIHSNNISSSGAISVDFETFFSLFFENNNVQNSITEECFMSVILDENSNTSISANFYQNVSGKCIISIKSPLFHKGKFDFNRIENCNSSDAVILSDSKSFSLSYNIFNNPSSHYDLKILSEGDTSVLADHNVWGGGVETDAAARIVDKQDSSSLLAVDVTPVLTQMDSNCSGLGCSNGRCVGPGVCWCDLGFSGSDCSKFQCSGVKDCSNHGECVGPNLCRCEPGWGAGTCELDIRSDFDHCFRDTITSPGTTVSASEATSTSSDVMTSSSKTDVSGSNTRSPAGSLIIIALSFFFLFNF